MSSKYSNQPYLNYDKNSLNELPCSDLLSFQVKQFILNCFTFAFSISWYFCLAKITKF